MTDTKKCSRCGEVKSTKLFWKRKIAPDGLRSACIDCESADNKTQYYKDPAKHSARASKWHRDNPERARELDRKRNKTEKRKAWSREWYRKNPERARVSAKRSGEKRKLNGKAGEYRAVWRNTNRLHWREIQNKSANKKRSTPKGRIEHNISSAIRISLKGSKSGRSWEDLVGYSVNELHDRLDDTMPEGYTWDDFMNGELHIDHIIPKSHFEYESVDSHEFLECWGIDNLQLLTAYDNLSKGANLQQ